MLKILGFAWKAFKSGVIWYLIFCIIVFVNLALLNPIHSDDSANNIQQAGNADKPASRLKREGFESAQKYNPNRKLEELKQMEKEHLELMRETNKILKDM
ncbi:hypothetical protein [Helicobacter sp. MIT 05-5294]|uniref:hypothetical protein n=1 Tax=Helicobacter sp. MIT 05-5294 TaxID=1548150 RepID=UPI00051FAB85|nr:hypothetical protein [Helicobacter sp. MIT 05-5294]TLD85823.1 hypothetical protein LS69_007965 [Helicobacter sp. MIT 05-5294]